MRRLALLLMIPALAMLMVPALASANWYYWWGIQGTWEMVATGGCVHSQSDFTFDPGTATWTPTGVYSTSIYVGQGTFTFDAAPSSVYPGYRTGTMTVTNSCVYSNGLVNQKVVPPLTSGLETFPLHWKIEDDGAITVQIPNVGLEGSGRVSLDHMSMTLVSTMQKQGAPGAYQICNISRVLFRVRE